MQGWHEVSKLNKFLRFLYRPIITCVMHSRFYLILSISAFAVLSLKAQRTLLLGQNNYDQQKGFIYNKEFATDFRIQNNGYALGIQWGTIHTYKRTSFYYAGMGELKHPQEVRQNRGLPFGAGGGFRGYTFGKQNNLIVLRGGVGNKRYLSEKGRIKGVAVAVTYEGGPTIGILKPYYLYLRVQPEDFLQSYFRSEKYSPENADRFLSFEKIFGADSFFKGITEIGVRPGMHAKTALHFDWGAMDEFIKALELGIMADAFFTKMPILVESPQAPEFQNHLAFINLFLTLQFGKRS